jgi:hypothetical protein
LARASLPAFSLLAVPDSSETRVAGPEALRELEHEWVAPGLKALQGRQLDRVDVVLMREAAGMTLHSLTRWAFWQFWRGRWPAATQPA